MKALLLSLFAILIISITARSQTMVGTYTNTWESTAGGALTYTLTLNPDNTFQFVSQRIYESSHPSNIITVVGTWENNNRLLILATDTSSNDIELVKRLNKNKARFKAYSPRHKKYGQIKPSLKFYESKVFYAKEMTLHKQADDIVVSSS